MTQQIAKSWIESANDSLSDFPLQNLPYGVFLHNGEDRIGVAIGDDILDLAQCASQGLLASLTPELVHSCASHTLNALMALGPKSASSLRSTVTRLLREDVGSATKALIRPMLIPRRSAVMKLPVSIGDYTDFYASIHHATNVGRIFRPDNPLMPNYKHLPIGYHGRASSIVVSGHTVQRPCGQRKDQKADIPEFAATCALDYELEIGMFIGTPNALGSPINISDAEQHIFGVCLLNDWSARDIQAWEYQPLGPFLGKSFATTISPWIITLEALHPFRVAAPRSSEDPTLLPYLTSAENGNGGGIDATLEVHLTSARMRKDGLTPLLMSRVNLRDLYWTFAQMVTHHTSNGCNLRTGDLLGTGTISGPTDDALGCLLELTRAGTSSITLPTGETRTYLQDGDQVTLRAYCEREGYPRIGFGSCTGTVESK